MSEQLGGGYDRHHVAVVVADHHGLGGVIGGDGRNPGIGAGGERLRVLDHGMTQATRVQESRHRVEAGLMSRVRHFMLL